MNYKKIIPFVALSAMMMQSCYDEKMEWKKNPSEGDLTTSELPLLLAEKISRYEALKNYITNPDFKLAIGVGLDRYVDHEPTTQIVDENFNELVIGYLMKHGPMVNNKGEINFSNVDKLFEKTRLAGMDVFGHTLIWHQNQKASYLNSLIADKVTVIPDEDETISNVINNHDFEDGNIDGWDSWGNSSSKSVSEKGQGFNSDYCMVLINPTDASSWSAQAAFTLPSKLEVGKIYAYSVMVKSDVVNPDFTLQVQNSQNYSGGGYVSGSTSVDQWIEISGEFECALEDIDRVCINFAKVAGTYMIDNFKFGEKIEVTDKMINILENVGFEDGTIDPWGGWGNNSTRSVSEQGQGYNSDYCMVALNPEDANSWSAQLGYDLPIELEVGKTYYYYAMVKADVVNPDFTFQVQNTQNYSGGGYVSASTVADQWVPIEGEFTCNNEGMNRVCINYGKIAGTYMIDDIKFGEKREASTKAPVQRAVIIEPQTDEEKFAAISGAMTDWISKMVTHCKNDVSAWDVVNEPMSDGNPYELKSARTASGELAEDEFYWQDYLGKDYAVMAFNLARQYGNPNDKMFINDYNLEYNLEKCKGLIQYVEYIESKGAIVDGIATQMHITIESDKGNIEEMFKLLAATGKLIKVSELDVQVKTASPTTEILESQADMYQFVIEMYMKHIPQQQQYGITIWGVSDDPVEHEYWLKDDAPNLWDANFNRKHAYKGVADGLAGKDVSEDFSGDLQY